VQRAMAKDPADRFPTMKDFCRELEACLGEARGGAGEQTVVLPPAGKPARPRRRRRLSLWVGLLLLLALAAGGAALAYALLRDGGEASTPPPPVVPHVEGVGAYDPFGGDGEHDADAPKATDRDTSTYWTTESYNSSFADLGKPGVGLVLDAGRPVKLGRLGIVTDTPGYTAIIKAGSSRSSFPKTVSAPQQVDGDAQYTISGDGSYRYYLIWITDLGSVYHAAHVNEVEVA
jgi:hypothetical protein